MSELALTNGHADPDVKRIVGDFGPRELVSVSKAASPQTRYALAGGVPIGDELGRSGLRHWGGFVFEEWLRELQQGRRAAEVFRDMMDSDAIVGAIMYAIEMLVRRVSWWWEPADSSRDAKQAADWCDGLLKDMRFSWPDTLSEIFSFLGYGYAYEEIVYKKRQGDSRDRLLRSKFDDNTIGVAKLALRSQDSLWKWVFDENDEIEGMIQNPPPDYLLRFIPLEKALHFRTKIFKNNPEGRPLAVDEIVPTPSGWTTMGTLQPGDQVFDENGIPRVVTAKSEVFTGRPVYEIEFTRGHTVRADAAHEWSVTTVNDRTGERAPRVLTTEQMLEWMRRTPDGSIHPGFCCGVAPVLDGRREDLPVDPYLLGYWLGDGTAAAAAIAVHPDDFPSLQRSIIGAGYNCRHDGDHTVRIAGGFLGALTAAGVLGSKHIPAAYLRASLSQRLALLQGLMDSDGYSPSEAAKDRASLFANIDARLVSGFEELIRTLGGQPRRRVMNLAGEVGGIVRGREVVATKDCYAVSFTLNMPAHRLPRKQKRQTLRESLRIRGHFVKAIRRVEDADTVCIEVDSPSHLFLAGEGMVPTHNSVLRSAYGAWYFAKNMRAIEGIGVERDLAGLPMLTPPEGVDIWNPNDPAFAGERAAAQALVSSVRRDEQEGIIKPYGWEFELVSTAGARQFDVGKIITRYETRIATSVLADLVMLGQDKVGSYALAVTKKDLFASSLGAYLDIVAAQFNDELVEKLWSLNGFRWPKPTLKHGAVETVDLDTLGNYIMRLGQSGAPIDWESVLPWASVQAGMPEPKPGHDFTPRNLIRPGSDAPPKDRLTAVVKADEDDGD